MIAPSVSVLWSALMKCAARYDRPSDGRVDHNVIGWGLSEVRSHAGTHGITLLTNGPAAPAMLRPIIVPMDGSDIPVAVRAVDVGGDPPAGSHVETTADLPPRPGSPISPHQNLKMGAIGCGLASGTVGLPPYFLTAKHVLSPARVGQRVFLGSREVGRVKALKFQCYYDVAVVRLESTLRGRWTPVTPDNAHTVHQVRSVTFDDIGSRAFVFRPTLNRAHACTIKAVTVSVWKQQEHEGNRVLKQVDLIMTTLCTAPGDSGTALFDRNGRVLGICSFRTLHHSFFTNAWQVLNDPVCRSLGLGG